MFTFSRVACMGHAQTTGGGRGLPKKPRSFTWRRGGIAQIFWKSGYVVCVWPRWAIHLTQKRIPTSIQKVGIKVGIKSGEFVIKFPPWSCQGIRNVDTRLPSQPLSIESVSKIRASIFTFKIEFLQFQAVQKFLNLHYNRVMRLDLGLCYELQSYEIQVIMDAKFSSKNSIKNKFVM